MKLDILSRRMMTERQGIRIRTCVTFNNKLRKFYVSIFQLEGLQASQAKIAYVNLTSSLLFSLKEFEESFQHIYLKVYLIL